MAAPGAARVTFVGHATVLIETGGLRILTDPMLRERIGPLRRHGHRLGPDDIGPIDVVLVSHAHRDHFDPRSLDRVHGDPVLVVPRGCARVVAPGHFRDVVEVVPGEEVAVRGTTIRATSARHGSVLTPMVPRSTPVGYVVDGPVRTYFAGDTDVYPGMAELAGLVDLALLPVWVWGPVMGPGHMDPMRAAQATAMIRPRWAMPIHWATFYPAGLDRLTRRHLLEPGPTFASRVSEVAPETEPIVLLPGTATDLASGGDAPATAGAAHLSRAAGSG